MIDHQEGDDLTLWKYLFRSRKGGVTVEFVTMLPLMVIVALLLWQAAVSVMAIMETESMIRDQGRLAASGDSLKEAENRGKESFRDTDYYYLESFKLKKEDDNIIATAETRIRVVFIPSGDFAYTSEKKNVIIQ